MSKYSKKAQDTVEEAMRKMKKGARVPQAH